ncbi:hypothetical protein BGX30_013162 [Mortierella sp. GBA39]|nr:hypothetical protein BGX30_013162 [Mortierella sp. GBA39]
MYISLYTLTCSTLGTLLLLSLLSDTPVAHARSLSQRRGDISASKLAAAAAAVDKRDLLGELIPVGKNGDPSSPAPAPAAPAPAPASAPTNPPSTPAPSSPPPAPAPEKKDPEPASEPATSSPQKTQGGPGLVEQLLGGDSEPDPPKQESLSSSSSPPATSAEHKKKPTQAAGTTTGGSGSSRTDDDSSSSSKGGNTMTTSGPNGDQDQDPATATSGVNSNNKDAATTPKEGLSSGIVAMIIIIVLGVLAAIFLSCYRIRQSRVRRKEREDCWDENILKNHVGTIGYNGGTNGSISGGSNGVGSIDIKSEALGDGGCHGATVEAAYARRGSLGGSSLRDNQSVGGGSNMYGGGGGTYSPYSQHAHAYSQGYPQQQQQQQQQGYGGGGYGGTYY